MTFVNTDISRSKAKLTALAAAIIASAALIGANAGQAAACSDDASATATAQSTDVLGIQAYSERLGGCQPSTQEPSFEISSAQRVTDFSQLDEYIENLV